MLLDTSGLLCLHHRREPFHAQTCKLYLAASNRLTHSYVLAEFITLAFVRGVRRSATFGFVIDLLANPRVRVIWVNELIHLEAMNLIEARPDKDYSMCDAVSFVLMRQENLRDALTTDRHFDQEGFRRLLV